MAEKSPGKGSSVAKEAGCGHAHEHGLGHGHETPALNPTQARVHRILTAADAPLSAYEVLDRMRPEGAVTPPTIYRSLERLIATGLAHRLESLNAYVACDHPHRDHVASFAICERCGNVAEFADVQVDERLSDWARANGFAAERRTVELRGRCRACSALS